MGLFSFSTFEYFDQAFVNKHLPGWFEENKLFYNQSVRIPFLNLIELINMAGTIQLSKRSISRPLRSFQKESMGYTKDFCKIATSEGFHFQIGRKMDDNFLLIKTVRYSWSRDEICSESFTNQLIEQIRSKI